MMKLLMMKLLMMIAMMKLLILKLLMMIAMMKLLILKLLMMIAMKIMVMTVIMKMVFNILFFSKRKKMINVSLSFNKYKVKHMSSDKWTVLKKSARTQ